MATKLLSVNYSRSIREGYDVAYSLDGNYYVPRCRPCHRRHDRALKVEHATARVGTRYAKATW